MNYSQAQFISENNMLYDDVVVINFAGFPNYKDESLVVMRNNGIPAMEVENSALQTGSRPSLATRLNFVHMQNARGVEDGYYLCIRMLKNGDPLQNPEIENLSEGNEQPYSLINNCSNFSTEICSLKYHSFLQLIVKLHKPSGFAIEDINSYFNSYGVHINIEQIKAYLCRAINENIIEECGENVYKFKVHI